MSLEVIEKVTQVEDEARERKAAADAEAKKIIADAEREGLALLQRVRAEAADSGGALLKQAEEGPRSVLLKLPPKRRQRLTPCGRKPARTWRRQPSLLSEGL